MNSLQQAIWEHGPDCLKERGVLIALADMWSRSNPEPYIPVLRVQELTGMSRRTVFRYIQKLEAEGWLERVARKHPNGASTSNGYRFNTARVYLQPSRWEAKRQGNKGCQNGTGRVSQWHPPAPCQDDTPIKQKNKTKRARVSGAARGQVNAQGQTFSEWLASPGLPGIGKPQWEAVT